MSENISTGTPGATTTTQTAAGKSPAPKGHAAKQPGTAPTNSGSAKSGLRPASDGASADIQSRNPLEHSSEGEESAQPKGASGLPEELDLDGLGEDELKKLSKWKKKIKVDGKEVAVPLLEAMKYLQKELAADRRMWEGGKAIKEAEQLKQLLKENPAAVLEQFGHNVDELAKSRVLAAIKKAEMSPEQIALEEARAEAEKYKQQLLAAEKARVEQASSKYKAEASQTIQNDIVSALQKSGLPPEPLTLKLTAQFMLANRAAGYKDFTASDAIPMVRDFCTQMARYYLKSMPMPDLFKALGDDWEGSLRKHLMEQSANPIKEGFKQAPQGQNKNAGPGVKKQKFMTADEYRAQLDKKWG